MDGITQGGRDAGVYMPMDVVCRGAMDGKERHAYSGKIFSQRRIVRKEMIVFLSVLCVSAREKILSFISANTVDILSSWPERSVVDNYKDVAS